MRLLPTARPARLQLAQKHELAKRRPSQSAGALFFRAYLCYRQESGVRVRQVACWEHLPPRSYRRFCRCLGSQRASTSTRSTWSGPEPPSAWGSGLSVRAEHTPTTTATERWPSVPRESSNPGRLHCSDRLSRDLSLAHRGTGQCAAGQLGRHQHELARSRSRVRQPAPAGGTGGSLRSASIPGQHTTDHRAYYDALPENPLEPANDKTTVLAKIGLVRASSPPWAPALRKALEATATIVAATRPGASPPSLYCLFEPPWPLNPIGFALPPYLDSSCANCVWRHTDGDRGLQRCRLASNAQIELSWPACERFEAELSCRTCAACCRAAYGSVEIEASEPIIEAHPRARPKARWFHRASAHEGPMCGAVR